MNPIVYKTTARASKETLIIWLVEKGTNRPTSRYRDASQICQQNPERVENFLKMHFCLYFCTEASEKKCTEDWHLSRYEINM